MSEYLRNGDLVGLWPKQDPIFGPTPIIGRDYFTPSPPPTNPTSPGALPMMPQIPLSGGVKHDLDKSRVDLIDPEFLVALGDVLKFGAQKYAAHNWRGGINISRIIGASLRHLYAIMRGEDKDPESGLRHTAHLACNVMFLHWMLINRPDLDDRYKGKK